MEDIITAKAVGSLSNPEQYILALVLTAAVEIFMQLSLDMTHNIVTRSNYRI